MLNHVAFFKPRSANSMLSLCHGRLPKVVSALFTTLNWGGGSLFCQCAQYFAVLAGMVSRLISKIVTMLLATNHVCSAAMRFIRILINSHRNSHSRLTGLYKQSVFNSQLNPIVLFSLITRSVAKTLDHTLMNRK